MPSVMRMRGSFDFLGVDSSRSVWSRREVALRVCFRMVRKTVMRERVRMVRTPMRMVVGERWSWKGMASWPQIEEMIWRMILEKAMARKMPRRVPRVVRTSASRSRQLEIFLIGMPSEERRAVSEVRCSMEKRKSMAIRARAARMRKKPIDIKRVAKSTGDLAACWALSAKGRSCMPRSEGVRWGVMVSRVAWGVWLGKRMAVAFPQRLDQRLVPVW